MKDKFLFVAMLSGLLLTFASQAQNSVWGVGMVLGVENHTLKIMNVLPNTPAYKAGLLAGLIVQKIDGTTTRSKPLKECVDLLRGAAGTKVKLELVDSAKSQTNTVELVREVVHLIQPELVPLNELPQQGYNSAPWVSSNGLTLYWQFTTKGEQQRWIWRAERKSAEALFENARKVVPGADPALTGDELEMILFDARTLYSSVRKTKTDQFSRPRKIIEFDGLGTLACPCLSEDGLTLWADRIENGRSEVVRFQRTTREGVWGKLDSVKMPMIVIGSSARCLDVAPKKGFGFCCVFDLLKDKTANNLVCLSTEDQGATFTNPRLVEIPKQVVRGKSPRYVAATRELFFAGELESNGSTKLFVIRNFDVSAMTQK